MKGSVLLVLFEHPVERFNVNGTTKGDLALLQVVMIVQNIIRKRMGW